MVAIPVTGVGNYFQQSYVFNVAANPEFPGEGIPLPGTVALGTDGTEWVFVRLAASQAVVAGDWLYVSSVDDVSWVATRLTQALGRGRLGNAIGVAGCTITSGATSTVTNFTGIWMCRKGRIAANIATGVTGFTGLFTTATAGQLNSTTSAGNNSAITGVVSVATAASNLAMCELLAPAIGANQ